MMTVHAKYICAILSAVLWTAASAPAQTADTASCKDQVFLKDGSVFTGQLKSYEYKGQLVIETWSGLMLHINGSRVKRVVQGCGQTKTETKISKTYHFQEKGWFHHTRTAILPGNNYFGDAIPGLSLYHVSGFQFNRFLGAGIGLGVETYDPESGYEPVTYPLMLEVRSYWMKRRISPYGALSLGYAWTGKIPNNWGDTNDFDGGPVAKVQVGYRFGNHFTMHGGLSFQQKTRHWGSTENIDGTDRILNKRLELGFGLLL
jgi:hypothetical protein